MGQVIDLDIMSNHHVQLMPRETIIDIIDRERLGEVSRLIGEWRAEGLSVDAVTVRLHAQGVAVTPKTLTRWLKRQEVAS